MQRAPRARGAAVQRERHAVRRPQAPAVLGGGAVGGQQGGRHRVHAAHRAAGTHITTYKRAISNCWKVERRKKSNPSYYASN